MELRIINPQENGFVQEIQWNHEELKAEIAAKMNDYKSLAFTEETIKEAKADRANLRKLKEAFETERKRIKKLCIAPYEQFEKQIKEVTALIDEPIQLIDVQIKEVDEKRKSEKRLEIEELFKNIGFQDFVTLDSIFDSKWLNVTVSVKKIEEQMRQRMHQIGQEIFTIKQLPEYSFEAMEVYKKTLNLTSAINEGQRLLDMQKRKQTYEEEQRRRQEAEKARVEEEAIEVLNAEPKRNVSEKQVAEVTLHTIEFRVTATAEQLKALKEFMRNNQIQYGPVFKKGE